MNMLKAMRDTLDLLSVRMKEFPNTGQQGCTLRHFESMYAKVIADHDPTTDKAFNEGKLGRWLGWMQGAAAASGYLTLDEAKEINKKWSDQ